MLRYIKAGLVVAVVRSGNFCFDLFFVEQAEGDRIQGRLPPCAVLDSDLARGRGGVFQIVAVLAVAERADCLFKIARLAVVFAAVVRADVITLGAYAVHEAVLMRLDDRFSAVVEAVN